MVHLSKCKDVSPGMPDREIMIPREILMIDSINGNKVEYSAESVAYENLTLRTDDFRKLYLLPIGFKEPSGRARPPCIVPRFARRDYQ
jgi:hypothetical protein